MVVISKSEKSLLINLQPKKQYIMIIQTFILFLAIFSCQEPKAQSKVSTKPKIAKIAETKKALSNFVGNYSGTHNDKEIFVTLTAIPRTNKIKGVLTNDGRTAQIAATEINSVCRGIIIEDDTQKKYNVILKVINNKLHFDITFPEYNNQILAMVLDRSTLTTNQGDSPITFDTSGDGIISSTPSNGSSTKPVNRDRALVGKWRFTEVISSGSRQFYSSFSTDYFLQFNANGECRTWTGSSAGGSGNVSYDGTGSSNLEIAQWRTIGKNVVFINPTTNKEMSIPYFAEENRMMLKGNLKRVYQRVD
jgi:hypothetical protein